MVEIATFTHWVVVIILGGFLLVVVYLVLVMVVLQAIELTRELIETIKKG